LMGSDQSFGVRSGFSRWFNLGVATAENCTFAETREF
jgi:hypothetical protein